MVERIIQLWDFVIDARVYFFNNRTNNLWSTFSPTVQSNSSAALLLIFRRCLRVGGDLRFQFLKFEVIRDKASLLYLSSLVALFDTSEKPNSAWFNRRRLFLFHFLPHSYVFVLWADFRVNLFIFRLVSRFTHWGSTRQFARWWWWQPIAISGSDQVLNFVEERNIYETISIPVRFFDS